MFTTFVLLLYYLSWSTHSGRQLYISMLTSYFRLILSTIPTFICTVLLKPFFIVMFQTNDKLFKLKLKWLILTPKKTLFTNHSHISLEYSYTIALKSINILIFVKLFYYTVPELFHNIKLKGLLLNMPPILGILTLLKPPVFNPICLVSMLPMFEFRSHVSV